MKNFLKGKKTYVLAGGSVLLGVALFFGLELPADQVEALQALLTGAALAALRAGVEKSESASS